jgi:hypothetical protein
MIDIIKKQSLAALMTLKQCIDNCPDKEWHESHKDAPFSQVIFHTLFYTDLYLSKDAEEFKKQLFHLNNKNIFRDYEELEYKKPEQIYTKEEIILYYDFCYKKIIDYKENDLTMKSNFGNITIYEKIICGIIRHLQHHAAQLGLRIQQITGKELEWINTKKE